LFLFFVSPLPLSLSIFSDVLGSLDVTKTQAPFLPNQKVLEALVLETLRQPLLVSFGPWGAQVTASVAAEQMFMCRLLADLIFPTTACIVLLRKTVC
jgi:hypothetical protein